MNLDKRIIITTPIRGDKWSVITRDNTINAIKLDDKGNLLHDTERTFHTLREAADALEG